MSIALAGFLPAFSDSQLRAQLGRGFVTVDSWPELERVLSTSKLDGVILDPAADGGTNLPAVISLLRKYPLIPSVAYVPLCHSSFHSTRELLRHGLLDAVVLFPFIERAGGRWKVIADAYANKVAKDFLGFMEPNLARLPLRLAPTILDLFQRPHRYQTATDIALGSTIQPRKLYRAFVAAGLGTPKKLLVVAKLLRVHAYTTYLRMPFRKATRKAGYSDHRALQIHLIAIFGRPPAPLFASMDRGELVRGLLKWFFSDG